MQGNSRLEVLREQGMARKEREVDDTEEGVGLDS